MSDETPTRGPGAGPAPPSEEPRAHDAGITIGGNADLEAGGDITGRDRIEGDNVRGHKNIYLFNSGTASESYPVRRRRPPPTIPALPTQFISRPRLFTAAKSALLEPGNQEAARAIGLVGMGGAGKSTLANALARDPDILKAFPSGVVRLELGPAPDLVAQQARLASLLGDARPILNVQEGLDRLNDLLDGASILLLLDNVWDIGYVHAFTLLHSGCALLVTTRDRDALDHAAIAIQVDTLELDQSRNLLAAWAGQGSPSLPTEAEQVAHECGGLPLALAIAGGMVADGHSWSNVLRRLQRADLDKLRARFKDYQYPNLLRALDASVTALANEERTYYLNLSVFDSHGPLPVEVVYWWWQHDGLDELDAEDLLTKLIRCSLVQQDETTKEVTLHDLQFDYCRASLGIEGTRDLHNRIIDRFLNRWGGLENRLHGLQVPDRYCQVDQYGLGYLALHMMQAERSKDLHLLLDMEWPLGDVSKDSDPHPSTNAWWLAHERAQMTDVYMRDIRLARHHAEGITDQCLEEGKQAPSVGLEVRYALVLSSMASIAANLPSSLSVALVRSQLWTTAQALAYIRAAPGPVARAQALSMLAAHLPEPERTKALDDALHNCTVVKNSEAQAHCLAMLAPQLATYSAPSVLAVANGITSPYWRAQALTALLGHVAEPNRKKVLEYGIAAARSVIDPEWRIQALMGLAPHLPDAERMEALAVAFNAAFRARNPLSLVLMLAAISPHLPEPHQTRTIERTFALAQSLKAEELRVRAFVALASHLPASQLLRAMRFASEVRIPRDRRGVLASLAASLPEPYRSHELRRLLGDALKISESSERVEALVNIVRHLPEAQGTAVLREAARKVALEIRESNDLAGPVVESLALHFSAELLPSALSATRNIGDSELRADALRSLAPYLKAHEDVDAAALAETVRGPDKIRVLAAVAAHLPEPDRIAVLRDVVEIADANERLETLVNLVPHLPEPYRNETLTDALVTIRDHYIYNFAAALESLTPYLNPRVLNDVLGSAGGNAVVSFRVEALGALAAHLPEHDRMKVLNSALRAARRISFSSLRIEAFAALTPQLPESKRMNVLKSAVDTLESIEDPVQYVTAIAVLAPHLPETTRTDVLNDALEAVNLIEDPDERVAAVAALAPHLPETTRTDVLNDALEAVNLIEDSWERAEAIGRLVRIMKEDGLLSWRSFWRNLLTSRSMQGRETLTAVVGQMGSVLTTFGSPIAVHMSWRALGEVARWWP